MKIERVSIEDNFFQDLGAHSLLMARFCSEIRKSLKSDVSMRDIYLNPTIAKLAESSGHADGRGRGCDEAAAPHTRRPIFNITAAARCSSSTTPAQACPPSG